MPSNTLPIAEPRLQGRWRDVMRALWLVVVGGVLLIYIVGMPIRVAHLTTVVDSPHSLQLTLSRVEGLRQLGISRTAYYAYVLTLELTVTAASVVIGALMVWRSDTWAALVVSRAAQA